MGKMKIGIIGCGGIANAKHLPALKALPDVEIIAFCDTIEERARKAADEFGVDNSLVCTDYHKIIENTDIEIIHVLTPNNSHCSITVDALEGGKHVMCEKPMAKTYAEAKLMLETAEKTGNKLTIGYQNRFREDSAQLKKLCERGDLGEIYYAKAHALRRRAVPTWGVFLDEEKQGGGPLIDIGTHALDLALWTMNNYNPKFVVGSVYKKLGKTAGGNAWGPWNHDEFTVEDSAFGYIVMENGATISLESSWALNILDDEEAKVTLCGTKAGADMMDGLRINYDDLDTLYVAKPDFDPRGAAFFTGSNAQGDAAVSEARAWIDSIQNDTQVPTPPEQAIVVTQLLEAIYESGKTGNPVFL
ncbi:Gfo/Idh/MocA family protein [Oceanobacillus oncorhynchi]|uniref:Gfo/Idh/MocA family protein n=1 Tax=Oceanobacillus oncorhynchi TaxID=545501 RepID=UPI0034D7AA28